METYVLIWTKDRSVTKITGSTRIIWWELESMPLMKRGAKKQSYPISEPQCAADIQTWIIYLLVKG